MATTSWEQWTYCTITDMGTCRLVDPQGYATSDPTAVLGGTGTSATDAYVVMEGSDPRIRVHFQPWVEGFPTDVNIGEIYVGFRYVAKLADPGPSGVAVVNPEFYGYHLDTYWGPFTHTHPELPTSGEWVAYDDVTYWDTMSHQTWDYVRADEWNMEIRNTSGGVVWLSMLQYGGRYGAPDQPPPTTPLEILHPRNDGRATGSADILYPPPTSYQESGLTYGGYA